MAAGLGARFRLLLTASTVANLADGVNRVALPLLATSLTEDPVAVSALRALGFLPWLLFALPAGALVDRADRRRAMVVAGGVRAAALLALGAAALTGGLSLAALYVVAFVAGLAETGYDSAARAMLPLVVGHEQLDRGNGLLTAAETGGETFVGAPIGSLLFSVAVAAPLLVTGGGYALAAVVVLALPGGYRPVRTVAADRPSTLRRDIVDGLGWLWRHRLLRGMTAVSGATSLVQSMSGGVLVLFALDVLGIDDAGYGLLLTGSGVGALLGGLTAARAAGALGRVRALVCGAVLAALGVLGMGLVTSTVVAGVLYATSAFGVMWWNVLTMSLRQVLIPEELFGRVQGGYRTVVWGGIPIGALLGGLLADAASVRTVFVVSGTGLLALAVVLGRLLAAHRDQLIGPVRSAG